MQKQITDKAGDHERARNHKHGFSLVETLVAITVLISAVTGVLAVSARSLRLTSVAREQLIAFYLAQDPIEYIRNVRDSNRLESAPWLTGLDECVNLNCTVKGATTGGPPSALDTCTGSCPPIRIDSATGIYGYDTGGSWAATKFTRTARIVTPIAGQANEARIDVSVSWLVGDVTRMVRLQEYILNW